MQRMMLGVQILIPLLELLLLETGCTAWSLGHAIPHGSRRVPAADVEGHHTNVIFIMVDDLGYGDLRYMGGNASTPNLDAMAEGPHSIQLTRYYAGAPLCTPTRGTVLTGRNHNRYCIDSNAQIDRTSDSECHCDVNWLPSSEITVSEILKENGYRTAVFGKWGLGLCNDGEINPNLHGFDKWWVVKSGVVSSLNPNCNCFENCECVAGHWPTIRSDCTNYYTWDPDKEQLRPYPKPIEGDDSRFIVDLFETFLENVVQSGRPFFVYLPFTHVHQQYVAIEESREWYLSQGYNPDQADFYGTITALDSAVGQIRQLLRQYDISDNTMLWFTSDNGPPSDTAGSTAGLKGEKRSLFEGGIRVPGIIEWPAEITENRVSDFPIVSSDLLPTVCDILDIDPPQDRPIDGTSLLPFIRGEVSSRNKPIAWEFNGVAAFSDDQYKLVIEYENEMEHLYDLVNDPFEQEDISAEHPALFEAMKEGLVKWQQSVASDSQQCWEDALQCDVMYTGLNREQ